LAGWYLAGRRRAGRHLGGRYPGGRYLGGRYLGGRYLGGRYLGGRGHDRARRHGSGPPAAPRLGAAPLDACRRRRPDRLAGHVRRLRDRLGSLGRCLRGWLPGGVPDPPDHNDLVLLGRGCQSAPDGRFAQIAYLRNQQLRQLFVLQDRPGGQPGKHTRRKHV
jgi:hypothetical protein